MTDTPFDWHNATTSTGGGDESTPLSATNLESMDQGIRDYVDERTETPINVEAHGASAGASAAANVTAINLALAALPANGGEIFLPNLYDVNDTLTIPDIRGFSIRGASVHGSGLNMAVNNKPILKTSGQFQLGYRFENLHLTYATQQTEASHPLSDAICLDGPSQTNVYYSTFRNLYITKATNGIKERGIGGADWLSTWACTFEDIQGGAISRSFIDLIPIAAVGQPPNILKGIRYTGEGGPTPTNFALRLFGETVCESLDIEDWPGTMIYHDSGNFVLNGFYCERWVPTNLVAGIYLSNGSKFLSGLHFDALTPSGFQTILINAATGSNVTVRGWSVSGTDGGGGCFICNATVEATGQLECDKVRVVGTPPWFRHIYPDANSLKNGRLTPGMTTVGTGSVATGAMTLPELGDFVSYTGTADITSIETSWIGRRVTLAFSGTAATNGVVDGSNLKLAGNLAYTPNDTLTVQFDGTNWWETGRSAN